MKFKEVKKQKGFTMIELVIVIAILGVLAAFALPRFANFSNDAVNASSQSIRGTISASAGILKAKYISGGSSGTTIAYNGYNVPVTASGDINFAVAAATNQSCSDLMNALLTNSQGLTFEKNMMLTDTCLIRRENGKYSNGLAYISFNQSGVN